MDGSPETQRALRLRLPTDQLRQRIDNRDRLVTKVFSGTLEQIVPEYQREHIWTTPRESDVQAGHLE